MKNPNRLNPNFASRIHPVDSKEGKNIFLNKENIPPAREEREIGEKMVDMNRYFDAIGFYSLSFELSDEKRLVVTEAYERDFYDESQIFTWTLVAVVDSTGQFLTYGEFTNTNDYPLEESVRKVKGKVYVEIGSRFFWIDYR